MFGRSEAVAGSACRGKVWISKAGETMGRHCGVCGVWEMNRQQNGGVYMSENKGWERYFEAKKMSDEGKTLKEIGRSLGLSSNRARQLILKYDGDVDFFNLCKRLNLSNKAYSDLHRLSILTEDDLKKFITEKPTLILRNGELRVFAVDQKNWAQQKSVSADVYNELREKLGFNKMIFKYNPMQKRIDQSIAFLERVGYTVK